MNGIPDAYRKKDTFFTLHCHHSYGRTGFKSGTTEYNVSDSAIHYDIICCPTPSTLEDMCT
jgi:hypothetical protein